MEFDFRTPAKKPLPLGTILEGGGRIGAVMWMGGERYYQILSKDGMDVSLMPADVVEGE